VRLFQEAATASQSMKDPAYSLCKSIRSSNAPAAPVRQSPDRAHLRRVSFFRKLVARAARAFGVEAAKHLGHEHGIGVLVEVTLPHESFGHLLGRTLAHAGLVTKDFFEGREDPVRIRAHPYVATGHLSPSGSLYDAYSSSPPALRIGFAF
jgi:hypothetical protein